MRGNPFLRFHRSAEAAGYPALLIVSVVCLALVVTPILLLGLTDAGWVLALALLNLIVAIGVLAGAVLAALSDVDERAAGPASRGVAASDERDPIVPLPRRPRTTRHAIDATGTLLDGDTREVLAGESAGLALLAPSRRWWSFRAARTAR